jgi:hypothetical protein
VVSASTIVDAVKKESGREKREGKERFLGAFSKADSLCETRLERKNKKPRKVRHWKPIEVEEADFNSSTALGRLNSTTSLLGRLGISLQTYPTESLVPRKMEKMLSSVMLVVPVMESTQIMLGVGVALVKLHVCLPLVSLTQTFILV